MLTGKSGFITSLLPTRRAICGTSACMRRTSGAARSSEFSILRSRSARPGQVRGEETRLDELVALRLRHAIEHRAEADAHAADVALRDLDRRGAVLLAASPCPRGARRRRRPAMASCRAACLESSGSRAARAARRGRSRRARTCRGRPSSAARRRCRGARRRCRRSRPRSSCRRAASRCGSSRARARSGCRGGARGT